MPLAREEGRTSRRTSSRPAHAPERRSRARSLERPEIIRSSSDVLARYEDEALAETQTKADDLARSHHPDDGDGLEVLPEVRPHRAPIADLRNAVLAHVPLGLSDALAEAPHE